MFDRASRLIGRADAWSTLNAAMPEPARLLILGGTGEAADLARCVVARFPGLDVVSSLAGRLPDRPPLPGRMRIGGFGGADGLARYLASERIDLVIDATHPFAAAISGNAAAACATAGVPRLLLLRRAWRAEADDRWIEAETLEQAAALLPALARRVFLTTGHGGMAAFAGLPDVWFLVRLFAAPLTPPPLPRHETIIARPPFTREGEAELIARYRIDALVTKNSGGPTEPKLQAARAAGIPVVMIARPRHSDGEAVETVADALLWLEQRL